VQQQPEKRFSARPGQLIKPGCWLWLASSTAILAIEVLLDVSAGEPILQLHIWDELLQAALTGSVLTALICVFWVLRHSDEFGANPVLLWFLAGILGLILFASGFYAVENYQGKRAWLKCLRTSIARGEKLEMAGLAPPPVPDAENFAMQPVWVEAITAQLGAEKARAWYGNRVNAFSVTNAARPLDLELEKDEVLERTNYSGSWQLAGKTDLTIWQDYYRQLAQRTNFFPVAPNPQSPAEDVMLALSRDNDTIEALRTASRLRYARFPLDYADENPAVILLPHLALLKRSVQYLRLRTSAELQAGKSAPALEDIKLMLQLNDLLREEPFLISHLVHIAMWQLELQPIWEGLADQCWNDSQLAQLDARLAGSDFLKCHTNALAGERAYGCQLISYLERNRRQLGYVIGLPFNLPGHLEENETLMKCLAVAIPRGWFDQNKATIWRLYDEHLDHLFDMETRTYSSTNSIKLAAAENELAAHRSPYTGFAEVLLPGLAKAAKRSAFAQQTLDFVRLAIALERYRLANQQFPDTLEALSPKFLVHIPHDIVNGQPLQYRRSESGSFVLYSVGWNETDDGGKVSLTQNGRPNPEAGDWVWRYPGPGK
jgi:hypothetical protein